MKRTPLRRVSKKRAKANSEYAKRRIAFLHEHPFCQFHLAEWCLTEDDVSRVDARVRNPDSMLFGRYVPWATEIHHMKKPKSRYLNDESTWMAVSRAGHNWIENNKAEARKRGYLYDI